MVGKKQALDQTATSQERHFIHLHVFKRWTHPMTNHPTHLIHYQMKRLRIKPLPICQKHHNCHNLIITCLTVTHPLPVATGPHPKSVYSYPPRDPGPISPWNGTQTEKKNEPHFEKRTKQKTASINETFQFFFLFALLSNSLQPLDYRFIICDNDDRSSKVRCLGFVILQLLMKSNVIT